MNSLRGTETVSPIPSSNVASEVLPAKAVPHPLLPCKRTKGQSTLLGVRIISDRMNSDMCDSHRKSRAKTMISVPTSTLEYRQLHFTTWFRSACEDTTHDVKPILWKRGRQVFCFVGCCVNMAATGGHCPCLVKLLWFFDLQNSCHTAKDSLSATWGRDHL